ncbi:hypothetical protein CPC16_001136 [Podila verticillata]|nr:hypothetical protein CPC16_001136 [Podila verticillata]KAI9236037.1 MAG: hypothetical protein BYD32DRAFT_419738 [Podila humilis]KFH64682.1 hypothetical protein MVEG_09414 [Podila verticillata NRRL 6337]
MAAAQLFQSFQSGDHVIKIPVMLHPASGQLMVIWNDIKDCFPGLVRIQDQDAYVPLLRDSNLYRVKPHGIQYRPGVVLDVVYEPQSRVKLRIEHGSTTSGSRANTSLSSLAPSTPSVTDSAPHSPKSQHQHRPPLLTNGPGTWEPPSTSRSSPSMDGSELTPVDDSLGSQGYTEEAQLTISTVSTNSTPHVSEQPQNEKQPQSENTKNSKEDRATQVQKSFAQHLDLGSIQPFIAALGLPPQTRPQLPALPTFPHALTDAVAPNGKTTDDEPDNSSSPKSSPVKTEMSGHGPTKKPNIISWDLIKPNIKKPGDSVGSVSDQSLELAQLQHPAPSPRQTSPSLPDIVAHRMKDVLAKQYTWLEGALPKFFIILPGEEDTFNTSEMNWSDFDLSFLCDCSGIPGFEDRCFTHVQVVKGAHYGINAEELGKIFGTYMMGILEMMKYGIYTKTTIVPSVTDIDLLVRIESSIEFLTSQGVESSLKIHGRAPATLDLVQPIKPIDGSILYNMFRIHLSGTERPTIRGEFVYMTSQGDIRWICSTHWSEIYPKEQDRQLIDFLDSPETARSSHSPYIGTYHAIIRTREKAKEFYKLALTLTNTPVLRITLDWDMTYDDERALQMTVMDCCVASIQIQVRDRPPDYMLPGFGHGYFEIVLAGLVNPKIQAFSLEKRDPDNMVAEIHHNDELHDFQSDFYLDPVLAKYKRDPATGKIHLAAMVTDLDLAADVMRKTMKGYHTFSELSLEISYWDQVRIQFCADGMGEGDVEDTHLWKDPHMTIFDKRGHDAIKLHVYHCRDSQFLQTGSLTELLVGFTYPKDVNKIRSVIKRNRRLAKLELTVQESDDACQIFESFKALLANHPAIECFHIRQERGSGTSEGSGSGRPSNYTWRELQDRAKMTLDIECFAGDKIGPMLQKFATCISTLAIHGMDPQESAVLEKVTRLKKGPFKIRTASLLEVCSLSPAVLEDLKKVVNRAAIPYFAVSGPVVASHALQLADFLASVGTKLTRLHLYGEHTKEVMLELGKLAPLSCEMPLLTDLSLTGPVNMSTQDMVWLRAIFGKEGPLTDLNLKKINFSHQGWLTLAQEIDFLHLRNLRLAPSVPIKIEAMNALVRAVPDKTEMLTFHIDSDGVEEIMCKAYKSVLQRKMKGGGLIMINRYF